MHNEPCVGAEPEVHTSENLVRKDADLCATSPCLKVVLNQNPVKKQTRQWAAWTRQEEENFFNALRLVGKDFDKITCRVQTKNKDQVRHYYYRLIRRMNKLLGPGFCLDAKNSKDTIAAMLRWWSLLEKYSCTASKLHLKPRRFKIFVEALEHQLLKDRKKNRRRRPQGESCHVAPSTPISLLTKAPGNDARLMKVLIVDGHNVQKVGSAKATSLKRNVSSISTCNRSDSTLRNARQRRRTGNISPALDKMDEKAASYGVSLVAYAAEHLEQRTSSIKSGCWHDGNQTMNDEEWPQNLSPSKNFHLSPTSQSACLQNIPESNGQLPVKLKLQLFPVDEETRFALEKDEHNPHLELTLSARKKISSVLEHLNRKWASSSITSSGELMIFPYSRQEAVSSSKRWTLKDTISTAADVYAAIGCPTVFRLRYGWFPNLEEEVPLPASMPQSRTSVDHLRSKCSRGHKEVPLSDGPHIAQANQLSAFNKSQPASLTEGTVCTSSSKNKLSKAYPVDQECRPVSTGCATRSMCLKQEISGVMKSQWEDAEIVKTSNGIILSAGEWADSLTNISVSDLLSEASRAADAGYTDPPAPCFQSMPFTCDSFDAAIAAHISSASKEQQNHVSIWDSEETRDAFSFQKLSPLNRDASSPLPDACMSRNISDDYPAGRMGLVEGLGGSTEDPSCEKNLLCGSISSGQDHRDSERDQSSTDMYWPDSLGPLDLDICSRYHGPEPIFGDSLSLSGLNRLIASSLDAFQSCSFFSSDKKECLASETVRD